MRTLSVTTEVPTDICMRRVFDAPRHLVKRAMTEPDLIRRWLGNSCSPIISVAVDLRVGGRYRYVFQLPKGGEFAFSGVFLEISDDRIVHTEAMEGAPGEATVTTTLVESDGKTTMTAVMRFPSQEMRDAVLSTGMADGASESYDNLAVLVASL
jgi:uncharacterized protein YndB with AHSA1/START domain